MRRLEERNKRRLTKETTELYKEALSIIASWLRDLSMIASGAPELLINSDVADEMAEDARHVDLPGVSMALASVREAKRALDYNVSPETCFDNVLFKIKEAFR